MDGRNSQRQKPNVPSLVVIFRRRCGHDHQTRPSPMSAPPWHTHHSAHAPNESFYRHVCRNINFGECNLLGELHLVTRLTTFKELSKPSCYDGTISSVLLILYRQVLRSSVFGRLEEQCFHLLPRALLATVRMVSVQSVHCMRAMIPLSYEARERTRSALRPQQSTNIWLGTEYELQAGHSMPLLL